MSVIEHEPRTAITPADAHHARKAGAIALLASLLLIGLRYAVVEPPVIERFIPADRAFVSLWDPPITKLDTMIDVGDGQAWAALGRDPTYSHPEVFYEGTTEFVYRAQRPLPGWLLWAASLGQPDLVGLALIAMTAIGMGVLVWASVRAAAAFGRRAELGVLVGILPGSVFTVLYLGPDLLLLGMAIAGLCAWYRDTPRDRILAVALLTGASLGRETLVLIPAAIGLHALIAARARFVTVLPLAIPAVFLGGWIAWLHQRYGYWPSDADHLPRIAAPFVGLWRSKADMGVVGWGTTLIGVACVVLGIRRDPRSVLVWCTVALIPVIVIAGAHVWTLEPQRAFLPLFAFALLAALPFRVVRRRRTVPADHGAHLNAAVSGGWCGAGPPA